MDESSDESGGFHVDQRVHIAGDPGRIGIVRYVGVVKGHEGTWVGVDWDGDDDGKHDGSVAGVRYFDARTPRSGSLVRPRSLCGGVSVCEAVERRYRGDYTKEEEDEMYVLSTRNNRVSIEFVGKNKVQEKLSRFEDLIGASLAYLGISSAGPPLQINATIPNLKELDLTGNLLSKWQDIGAVCEQLPDLRVLNVSNNVMTHDIPELPSLGNIRVLVLNNCSITWKEVEVLKESLPKVEELHLMANKLSEITPAPPSSDATYVKGFTSLRLLNLEDNCIHSWDEVLKLSQLRSLEQLHLNKNKLRHIFYPAYHPRLASEDDFNLQDQRIRPFEKLHCLLLGCNEIEDLVSVDSLNSFPSLRDIRVSENPVVDPEKGGIPRFVQVARLAKAQILNGSEISPRERKESEIWYVRLVINKMHSKEIDQLHPRFMELKELHGIDHEGPSTGSAGLQKMSSGLLCVTLKCVGPSMGEKAHLTKKLPPTTSVGKLKVLCESLFKLKSIRLRLFLQEEGSPMPLLLDDDMDILVDVGIGNGATILVDEEIQ